MKPSPANPFPRSLSALLLLLVVGCNATDESDPSDGDAAPEDVVDPDTDREDTDREDTDREDTDREDTRPDSADQDPDTADTSRTLRPPRQRTETECPDYAALRTDFECTAGGGSAACATDDQCDGLCQPTFAVGDVVCVCAPIACESDGECADDEACSCAVAVPQPTDGRGEMCGFGREAECASRCLPAECRVDADCPSGEFCAVYYDFCGNRAGYACWGAETAECGIASDCPALDSTCQFDGDEWRCEEGGMICD